MSNNFLDGTDHKQNTAETMIGYSFAALAVAFVIFLSLNVPIGPAEETTGIVQVSVPVSADGPPPSKNVWIQLPNGTVVVINTHPNMPLTHGQKVKLLIYRRLLTNAKSYAIASSEVVK